jgi:hypothetical protein
MFVRTIVQLFAHSLPDAIDTVQKRLEAHRDSSRGPTLYVEDVTAKKGKPGDPQVVTALVCAAYASHADAAYAVAQALQFPDVSNDPKALVVVELQAREKK